MSTCFVGTQEDAEEDVRQAHERAGGAALPQPRVPQQLPRPKAAVPDGVRQERQPACASRVLISLLS